MPDLGSYIRNVKETLRAVPGEGIGYGVLRYMSDNGQDIADLQIRPSIIFNYLGHVNRFESEYLSNAMHLDKDARALGSERYHMFEINTYISEKQLHVNWSYSSKLHERTTVTRLIDNFLKELVAIVSHCTESTTGGYTPSDFPDAQLSQEDLDHLINNMGS
jgi:non-ribosomal peptide synthase protein (TIGR01720 family)